MAATRKKAIALLTTAAGLGILLVAGVALYWIWRLEAETGEERRKAAETLGRLGTVRAIPSLIDAFVAAMDRPGNLWWLDRNTSELYSIRGSWPNVAAVQSISNRTPQRTKEFLRSYLSDDRELARAVAASVLFEGTSDAQKYFSGDRMGGF